MCVCEYVRVSSFKCNALLFQAHLMSRLLNDDFKKYQILESIDESPQLPFGYTTSMLIALVPPVWFKLMNKRIPKEFYP